MKAPVTCIATLVLLLGASEAAAGLRPTVQEEQVVEVEIGRSHHLTPPWRVKGVSLTNPDIADVEVLTPELVIVTGKSAGVTDLTIWNEQGVVLTLAVEVALNTERIDTLLEGMFAGSDLNVANSQNVLVVSGSLGSAGQAEQLHDYLTALGLPFVDMTSLPGVQQVQVQVRIAEVSRSAIRSLGVNAFATGSDGFAGSLIGSSSGGAINPVSIGVEKGVAAGSDLPFSFTSDVGVGPAVTLFAGLANANLELFLEALEENQYLRILAEPTLVALSGSEASFLAGGEFPIPVVQGGAGGASSSVTIEYKEFGVGLRFRPIVLGDGAIRLDISSEVSELTDIGAVQIQGFQVPGVFTRRADTTLEMHSGQTFAMAGLLSETTNAVAARTPFLGSLPVLGPLFRSVRYQSSETELVLMVRASLVEPVSPASEMPLPGDEHVVPEDWELYFLGHLEGREPARISPENAAWFRELGLDRLHGPGAWATHGDGPGMSRASVRDTSSTPLK